MKTTNTGTLSPEMYDLTTAQILRLVSSDDVDVCEFGTRFVLYLSWVIKNSRNPEEQRFMEMLLSTLVSSYNNPAFRQQLSRVLWEKKAA